MPEDILKLGEIRRRIDAAVQPAQLQRLKEISKQLNQPGYSCGYEVEALGDAIAFLSENRDRRSRENNVIARGAICIIDSLYRRLDAAGLPNLLSEIAPNFYQFNFVELGQVIDQELRLAHKASIFPNEYKSWLRAADDQKERLTQLCRDGIFRFSDVSPKLLVGYPGPGNSWEGFKGFLSGFAIAADVCTAPVTGGLAVASVLVGGAGALSAVFG